MTRLIDLTGEKFGRLTVTRRVKNYEKAGTHWECVCDCGTVKIIRGQSMTKGITQSCGCYLSEVTIKRSTKHGHANSKKSSKTYQCWENMIYRCNNKNFTFYKYYGGRGIQVCERWRNFKNFLEDMGEKPDNLTLDRIDTNKGYQPDNCKWASRKEQSSNRNKFGDIIFVV